MKIEKSKRQIEDASYLKFCFLELNSFRRRVLCVVVVIQKETSHEPDNQSHRAADHRPRARALYDGPSRDEVLALRHQYLSPGIITYYREPLMVVEGHMQYVWDETGTRYLDAFAGIVTISVGHCHPKVVQRVREQTGRLQHTTTIYLHPAIVEFAEKLAEQDAGRPHALLLHQQRQRGERNRGPLGPRVHRQPGRGGPAQRLPWRHLAADEPHRPRHMEVQIERQLLRPPHAGRLLLSLSVWDGLPVLRI